MFYLHKWTKNNNKSKKQKNNILLRKSRLTILCKELEMRMMRIFNIYIIKLIVNIKIIKGKRNNVSKTCLKVFKIKKTKFKENKHVKMRKTDYILSTWLKK